jgi:hypothetical protein
VLKNILKKKRKEYLKGSGVIKGKDKNGKDS